MRPVACAYVFASSLLCPLRRALRSAPRTTGRKQGTAPCGTSCEVCAFAITLPPDLTLDGISFKNCLFSLCLLLAADMNQVGPSPSGICHLMERTPIRTGGCPHRWPNGATEQVGNTEGGIVPEPFQSHPPGEGVWPPARAWSRRLPRSGATR